MNQSECSTASAVQCSARLRCCSVVCVLSLFALHGCLFALHSDALSLSFVVCPLLCAVYRPVCACPCTIRT